MTRIAYEDWKPGQDAIDVIVQATQIAADYAAQGYDLTLRQLYYQFVARDLIPNSDRSYKRLGSIVNRARMAGLYDWDYIIDRTRNLEKHSHFDSPAEIVEAAAAQFKIDKWAKQPTRVEVWVEKEALAGIVGQVAGRNDCAYFACRGYVSQSEQWAAGRRIGNYIANGQRVVVLHLGDHDPSGIDMTRDIRDRLLTFTTQDFLNANDFPEGPTKVRDILDRMSEAAEAPGLPPLEVRRIALNWDQIEQYEPPPNPAKMTDSRAKDYVVEYGYESWELDALDPAVLDALIQEHIDGIVDVDLWDEAVAEEEEHKALLADVSANWPLVVEGLRG